MMKFTFFPTASFSGGEGGGGVGGGVALFTVFLELTLAKAT